MKIVLSVLLMACIAVAVQAYTTKYDNIDLDEILKNDRLLNKYFECVMERGKCTEDGKALKEAIPDALQTDCSKCTEKQKSGTAKVIKFLVEHKKAMFDELSAKYDPEGIYKKKYNEEAKAKGIKLID
uniref:Chemosensory protein 1 n=1 Tax=Riptortus pedestris TaxID=329032 RepID=A0A2Z4HQ23_RIPPE|nr:chemosensory protein 1 [Riptortus pedestris]